MFFTALSYAAMSRAFPLAGSVYTYAQRGLHEIAGFFSGWLILLDYILVPSLLYLFSAVALRPVFPALPAWIWLVVFISFNAAVNLLGIQFTARVNRYMLVMELVILALFVMLGLVALYGGRRRRRAHLKPIYDPHVFLIGHRGWRDLDCGAVVSRLRRYIDARRGKPRRPERCGPGHSAVSAAGRRAVHAADLDRDGFERRGCSLPLRKRRSMRSRNAPAALRCGWSRSSPSYLPRPSRMPWPLRPRCRAYCLRWRAMASCRRFWRRVHPRFRTPYVSTLAVSGVSLLVGLLFADRIDDLTRIVNFGALTGFVLLHLSVINHYFFRMRSGDWFRHLIFPLIGMLIIIYVLYEMDRAAKLLGLSWIAIGVLYYLVLTFWIKKPAALKV